MSCSHDATPIRVRCVSEGGECWKPLGPLTICGDALIPDDSPYVSMSPPTNLVSFSISGSQVSEMGNSHSGYTERVGLSNELRPDFFQVYRCRLPIPKKTRVRIAVTI